MTSATAQIPENSRTVQAGLLGFGKLLIKLTGIVSAAVLTRILAKVDYAAYRQTLLSYQFVEPLLLLGLTQTLLYFIPRNRAKGRRMLTGNLLLLVLMGALFAAAVWLGGNELLARRFDNPAVSRLLLIYSPYAMLALPIGTIGSCMIACRRVRALTVYSIISQVVAFTCVLAFVLLYRSVDSAIVGVVVGGAVVFIPGVVLMYRATEPGPWRPELADMARQFRYAIPLGLAGILGMVTLSLDKVLVASLCPPEDFAVYINGAVEIPLIGIVTGSVMSILIPEFAAMFKRGESGRVIELWQKAMIKCAFLFFPLMVILMLIAPEIMRVLFGAEYSASSAPFRIYLLALPIRITQFAPIMMASGKNHLILLHTVGALVLNLVLSVALIRAIGYLGAAVATVILLYAWSIPFFTLFIRRMSGISMGALIPARRLGAIALASLVPGVLAYGLRRAFSGGSDALRLAVVGAAYFGLTAVLMQLMGLFNRTSLSGLVRGFSASIRGRKAS